MMWIVICAAMFCAGYLVGYDNGLNARFESIIELLSNTINPFSDVQINATSTPSSEDPLIDVADTGATDDPFARSIAIDPDDPFAAEVP